MTLFLKNEIIPIVGMPFFKFTQLTAGSKKSISITKSRQRRLIAIGVTVIFFVSLIIVENFPPKVHWIVMQSGRGSIYLLLLGFYPLLKIALSPSYEEFLESDNRPKILYLRPFYEDVPDATDDIVDLVFDHSLRTRLVNYFRHFGPIIAASTSDMKKSIFKTNIDIGYLSMPEEEWRQRVKNLINEASLIIYVPGISTGLQWEMSAIVDGGYLCKTIICFPEPRKKDMKSSPYMNLEYIKKGLINTKFGEMLSSINPDYIRGIFFGANSDEAIIVSCTAENRSSYQISALIMHYFFMKKNNILNFRNNDKLKYGYNRVVRNLISVFMVALLFFIQFGLITSYKKITPLIYLGVSSQLNIDDPALIALGWKKTQVPKGSIADKLKNRLENSKLDMVIEMDVVGTYWYVTKNEIANSICRAIIKSDKFVGFRELTLEHNSRVVCIFDGDIRNDDFESTFVISKTDDLVYFYEVITKKQEFRKDEKHIITVMNILEK